jgi:sugar lactone lactonase YvrE
MRYLPIPAIIMALQAGSAYTEDFNSADYLEHRTAATQALARNDFAVAESEIAKARAMLPSAPSVLMIGAQISLAAGKPEDAKAWLGDYLGRGLWFDPALHPKPAALLDPADRARLDANGSDFGTFATVAQMDELRLAEGVAVVGKHIYYTTIHDGALNRLGEGRPVHALPENLGAYGTAVRDGKVWMAVARDQAAGQSAASQGSELVQINPASGVVTRFAGDVGSRFGDIAAGKSDIYVSENKAGQVLALDIATGQWRAVMAAGTIRSPQGLAESADGKTLIVADYTSGLYRVDLASGAIRHLAVPETASLIGIDGVARSGDDLIVVQNGIQPPRVLRIHMSNDWNIIDSVEVLLRGGKLDEPTNGVVSGKRYIFVARSQWTDFDGEGRPKPTHGPVIIGEIDLNN